MKKKYISPFVSIEMFAIETVILEGSWNGDGDDNDNDGDNGDRVQAPQRPTTKDDGYSGTVTFRNKGFGSIW